MMQSSEIVGTETPPVLATLSVAVVDHVAPAFQLPPALIAYKVAIGLGDIDGEIDGQ